MFFEDRPKLKFQKSNFEKLLEFSPFIILLIGLVYTLFVYSSLPKLVPIHFNFYGDVDGYANKDAIWGLHIFGFVLTFLMHKLMQYPHRFNYPVKITLENAAKHYTQAIKMMTYMNIGIAVLVLIINYEIIRVALYKLDGFSTISSYLLNGILIAMVVIPIIQVIKTFRNRS